MSSTATSHDMDLTDEVLIINGATNVFHRPNGPRSTEPACPSRHRVTEARRVTLAVLAGHKRPCQNDGCFGGDY